MSQSFKELKVVVELNLLVYIYDSAYFMNQEKHKYENRYRNIR